MPTVTGQNNIFTTNRRVLMSGPIPSSLFKKGSYLHLSLCSGSLGRFTSSFNRTVLKRLTLAMMYDHFLASMMWFYLNGRGRKLDSFMNREDNSRINSFRVGINLRFMIIFYMTFYTLQSCSRLAAFEILSLSVHNLNAISKLVFITAITCLKTCNRSLEVFIFNITSRNDSPTSCKDGAGSEESCHPYVLIRTYTITISKKIGL